jgi:hypothetical protein
MVGAVFGWRAERSEQGIAEAGSGVIKGFYLR